MKQIVAKKMAEYGAKVWENYGKKRLYVNDALATLAKELARANADEISNSALQPAYLGMSGGYINLLQAPEEGYHAAGRGGKYVALARAMVCGTEELVQHICEVEKVEVPAWYNEEA